MTEPTTRGSCDGCIYFADEDVPGGIGRVEHSGTCGSIHEVAWPVPPRRLPARCRDAIADWDGPARGVVIVDEFDTIDLLLSAAANHHDVNARLAALGRRLLRHPHLSLVALRVPLLGRLVAAAAEAEWRDVVDHERKARRLD